ncbi:MAG: NAD-dependent epimerase/dehydratase family protein [Ferruginibacter sp.]
MKKILITGCNGFLGQHLTLFLAGKGFDVIATGRNECRIKQNASFIYESIDLTNPHDVTVLLSKYHLILSFMWLR